MLVLAYIQRLLLMMTTQNVWLLKAPVGSDDSYRSALEESGYNAILISPLSFDFIRQSELKNALSRPADFSGLIFTSPRAVEAVVHLFGNLTADVALQWQRKKTFVVGDASHKMVKEKLNIDALGKESGNANALADIIIAETEAYAKPLLFPAGNLKRGELTTKLVNGNRDFRAIECYETIADPSLKENLQAALDNFGVPHGIVFFSPSGVRYSMPVINSLKTLDLSNVKIFAIGPTTCNELVEISLMVDAMSPNPNAQSLVQALEAVLL